MYFSKYMNSRCISTDIKGKIALEKKTRLILVDGRSGILKQLTQWTNLFTLYKMK